MAYISNHRWLVECDDDRKSFPSRSAARDYAAWLNRHPSNVDIRRFGPYLNADGIARIIDLDGFQQRDGRYRYITENDAEYYRYT